MKLHETLFGRLLAQVLVYALLQASIPPAWAVSLEAPRSLPESPRQQAKPTAFESYAAELSSVNPDWDKLQRLAQSFPVIEKPAASRVLGASEMESRKGLLAVNPYVAGSQKWSVNYAGIDLLTGNYSTSATDISFEGGYGIPINVTRTYSSNNPDDGPLGVGWTLSVDIRSTAGGLLKSPGAPVRSAPVTMFDRPLKVPVRGVSDTYSGGVPLTEGVIAEDAGGFQEHIQRDVDGILSTPPWDSNVISSVLEFDEDSGKEYWMTTSNVMTTPEGSIYEYEKVGSYTNGGSYSPWDTSNPQLKTPSNVLKIKRITDRHGNITEFTYGSAKTYAKANGTTSEQRLTKVTMPGGRELNLTYAGDGNHVTEITDGTASGSRKVTYGYGSTSGQLETVTTGLIVGSSGSGLATGYTYGSAKPSSGWGTREVAGSLLKSITNPRGLTTKIKYIMADTQMAPYTSWYGVSAPIAYAVIEPSGVWHWAGNPGLIGGFSVTDDGLSVTVPSAYDVWEIQCVTGIRFQSRIGPANGALLNDGALVIYSTPATLQQPLEIYMKDLQADTSGTATELNYPNIDAWKRVYDMEMMTLDQEVRYIYPWQDSATNLANRKLDGTQIRRQEVKTDTTYNFLGAPRSKTITEGGIAYNGTSFSDATPNVVEYAYHGEDKYFQQKAVRVKTGGSSWRYSYTDYYTKTDTSTGAAKGMTKYVYDAKYGGITATGSDWRTGTNSVAPTSGQHAAEFKYDSKGRVTEVQKLQSVSGSTYTRVKTTTSYNSDGSPGWGLPYQVKEDEGSGKINRTTTTTAYDPVGRATHVTDAAGRTFETVYNAFGQVTTVTRTDTNPDVGIVQYSYGVDLANEPESYGMVVLVEDLLSGAWTSMAYNPLSHSNLAARGQVASVVNGDGLLYSDYTVNYTYDTAGRRSAVEYDFDFHPTGGNTYYGYRDYVRVGSPESPNYAFQTMTLLVPDEGVLKKTAEEFHYQFDTAGRLTHSAFAQSSDNSNYPFYPDLDNPGAAKATRRAHVVYDYLPSGQLDEVRYAWQDLSGSSYTDTYLRKVSYTYEDYKGLRKTATRASGAGGATWGSGTEDEYQYDADLDYLTAVDYSSTPGSSFTADDSWTYDAAGNRSNSGYTYDNLNRMTASPGATYSNDILGNRTYRNPESSGARQYVWDDAGRLLKSAEATKGATYMYRADGMRIKKVTGLQLLWIEDEETASGYYDEEQDANLPTWRYRYDGQMCFEEDYTVNVPGSPPTVSVTGTSYALGARGIDMMRTFTYNPYTQVRTYDTNGKSFPIYDGHGNMIATLGRSSSSPNYSIGNEREYDVWGDVRSTNGTGDPNTRYCANLGHKQDDESDLIYMRARYYEPGTGRFISEDPAMDGWNWFAYCDNQPVSRADDSGLASVDDQRDFNFWMAGGMIAFFGAAMLLMSPIKVGFEWTVAMVLMPASAAAFASAFGATSSKLGTIMKDIQKLNWALTIIAGVCAAFKMVAFSGPLEKAAVLATGFEALVILGLLVSMDYD
ncbi:MAG: RHS repeat-associated core domain-containing protein [Fimbriimonadaceae bacterium]|nr:RHS repeat-associated core domain-containing protein [Fimbriimonadaceae bacterium]